MCVVEARGCCRGGSSIGESRCCSGCSRKCVFSKSPYTLRPGLAWQASPSRLNGIGTPVAVNVEYALSRRDRRQSATNPRLTPHANALQFAKFCESVQANNPSHSETDNRDTTKAEIRLFNEVFQVHSVEGGEESSRGKTKGTYAELQVEEHEGIAIGVENCFNSVLN